MPNYYALDHPNPNARNRIAHATLRTEPREIRLLVVHTAETRPDGVGSDSAAERVANYMATVADRRVSWHYTTDSDTALPMLADRHIAWHVGGFNPISLGVEIATQAAAWTDLPDAQEAAMLAIAAQTCAVWARRYGIPVRRLTGAQARNGERGLVGHVELDPANRSDPGADFDWAQFLTRVAEFHAAEAYAIGDAGDPVRTIQRYLHDQGQGNVVGAIDGDFGPRTDSGVRALQRSRHQRQSGILTLAEVSGVQPRPEPRVIVLQPGEEVLIRVTDAAPIDIRTSQPETTSA